MMNYPHGFRLPESPTINALLLSDRLLTLAKDADQAGFRTTAKYLLQAALDVLDQPQAMMR